MDAQEILSEQIEAYLAGTLSAEDRAGFEQQLASDSMLRHEVDRHRKAAVALQHGMRRERKAALQAIDRELAGNTSTARRRIMPGIRRIAIAASFLVLVAAAAHIYSHQTYSTEAIAERMYAPAESEIFRGREEYVMTLAERFAEADEQFRNRNFDTAAKRYLEIIKENTLMKDQAEWNLLLCYFAQDPDSEKFNILFERLLSDTQHVYHEKALILQNTMQKTLYRIVN